MARFPRTEMDIMGLAQEMADGFLANSEIFPAPPVGIEELKSGIEDCAAARDRVQAAKAALEEAVGAKKVVFDAQEERMKKDIRYAENTVDFDNAKLKLIGWGGRKASIPLGPPGQVAGLVVRSQGDGDITLAWERPGDGGKVAAYKVKRREYASALWSSADMAMKTEITLTVQPRGKKLEYCVVAVNRAGEGMESNTVTALL